MQRPRPLAFALAAAGLMASISSLPAQTGAPPTTGASADSGRRFDPVSRLLDRRAELKLTDDQARRLEAIRSRYQEKHQAQIEQLRRDREARAAFRASMDSTRSEIMAVLTPEQQKQVGDMRRKRWKEHARHHKDRHGHDDDDDDDDR
jgi:Spy/CpxP family protein refolding chaperone